MRTIKIEVTKHIDCEKDLCGNCYFRGASCHLIGSKLTCVDDIPYRQKRLPECKKAEVRNG